MKSNEEIYKILIKCADHLLNCDLPEFIDAINELPMKINENFNTNLINGERLLIHNVIMNLVRSKSKYKDYPISYDIIEWVYKEFHDYYFDYDNIEESIIKCMDSALTNYNNN